MIDRSISAGCVVAYVLWALSVVLWCVSCLGSLGSLGQLAIIVSGAAATATVRTYFVAQHHRMKSALAVISSVQEGARVRSMR